MKNHDSSRPEGTLRIKEALNSWVKNNIDTASKLYTNALLDVRYRSLFMAHNIAPFLADLLLLRRGIFKNNSYNDENKSLGKLNEIG